MPAPFKSHHFKRFPAHIKRRILLSVLRYGRSVSQVCRENKIARKTFYSWKKSWQSSFGRGKRSVLRPKYRKGVDHPRNVRKQVAVDVLRTIVYHPEWGSRRIREVLISRGKRISNHAVHALLMEIGLSRFEQREDFARLHQTRRRGAGAATRGKRLLPFHRKRLVESVLLEGKSVAQACREFRASRKTYYFWKRRFLEAQPQEEGWLRALDDRYAHGFQHPQATPEPLVQQLIETVVRAPGLSVHRLRMQIPRIGHHGIQNILLRYDLNTFEKRLAYARLREATVRQAQAVRPELGWVGRLKQVFEQFIPTRAPLGPPFGVPRGKPLFWLRRLSISLLLSISIFFLLFSWGRLLGSASSTSQALGFTFASLALSMGTVFFLYSLKYYFTLAVVLSFSREASEPATSDVQKPPTSDVRFSKARSWLGRLFGIASSTSERTTSDVEHAFTSDVSVSGGLEPDLTKVTLERHPMISVHIPMYNEPKVAERILRACTGFIYQGRYEVVVADDSTDETTAIVRDFAARWNAPPSDFTSDVKGIPTSDVSAFGRPQIKVVHRENREGFKGGALREALSVSDPRAEFVVVFDADFVPYPDTLELFLKYFQVNAGTLESAKGKAQSAKRQLKAQSYEQANIAAIQGYQWHVLNKSENWITRGVRSEYAGSYVIERSGAELYGGLKQIAGSVYLIRRDLLETFGWGTSLTEDFELTLRLYAQGYRVVYTPYIQAPAECASTLKRLIRQRMRWAEGHSFNIRRMFLRLMVGEWSEGTGKNQPIVHCPLAIGHLSANDQLSNSASARINGTWKMENGKFLHQQGKVWRSSPLTFSEKLEFLYLSPYYLQAAFFLLGTISWLISETIFKARLPFWTNVWGWSLVLTNLFSLPLMNLVGLFLEEAEERDYLGIFSFVALSYLLVPFQAYAAVKGFIEPQEGPWFRTPKTGRITDILERGRFYRFIRGIIPGRLGGVAERLTGTVLVTEAMEMHSAQRAFSGFVIRRRTTRWVGRALVSILLIVSTTLVSLAPSISVSREDFSGRSGMLVAPERNGMPGKDEGRSWFPSVASRAYASEETEMTVIQRGHSIVLRGPKTDFLASEMPKFAVTAVREKQGRFWSFLEHIQRRLGIAVEASEEPPGLLRYRITDASDTIIEEEMLDDLGAEYSINPSFPFRPGKYRLEVTSQTSQGEEALTQDFTWGVLAINPNKSIYTPGETARLAMAVLDEKGEMVCDARLQLKVQSAKRKATAQNAKPEETILSTEDGSIRVNPECREKAFTLKPDYEAEYRVGEIGLYEMELSAETENGAYMISDKLEVREWVPFEIERISATRIFPVNRYPVFLKIKVHEDFRGEVVESVPDSFQIELKAQDANRRVTAQSAKLGVKEIIWDVEWKRGETYTLEYEFQAPHESPAFYLLGPLRLVSLEEEGDDPICLEKTKPGLEGRCVVFSEARQWQVAVDASKSVFMSGFETGSLSEWTTSGGTASASNTIFRSGGWGGLLDCCASFISGQTDNGSSSIGLSFGLRLDDSTPTAVEDILTISSFNQAVNNWIVHVLTDGKVRVENLGNSTNYDSSSAVFADATWHLVEFRGIMSDGGGSFGLRVDGLEVVAQTLIDTSNGIPGVHSIRFDSYGTGTADYVVDDVYYTQVSYPGDIKIVALQPNALGDYNAWDTYTPNASPNQFNNWNETPTDDDTSRNANTGSTDVKELHSVEDASVGGIGAGDTINDVWYRIWAKRGTGPGTTHEIWKKWAGSESGSGDIALDTAYGLFSLQETGTLSVTNLNSVQVGGRHLGAQDYTISTIWVMVAYSGLISISGTCDQYDQTTDCVDDGANEIRVAINGVLQAQSDTTVDGSWSITGFAQPSVGASIIVFINGETTASERATAATVVSSSGNILGVTLYQRHLTIGSNQDGTVTNADLSEYDYSASGNDVDVIFDVDNATNDLTVDNLSNYTDERLRVLAGDTYRPDSASSGNVTTHDFQNLGTVQADGNTFTVSGSWSDDGTFTANTSLVTFTSTSTGETLSGLPNGDSGVVFYRVSFNGAGGGWTIQDPMVVSANTTDAFVLTQGTVTLGNGGGDSLEVNGKMDIGSASGAATFQTMDGLAQGSTITIDINDNATPVSCTNCFIEVGTTTNSDPTATFTLNENTVLRFNSFSAAQSGVQVLASGSLNVSGNQDDTGTDTGTDNATLRETKICANESWSVDQHNGKHVRMTSGLAFGRIYSITDTLVSDNDCASNTHDSIVRSDSSSDTDLNPNVQTGTSCSVAGGCVVEVADTLITATYEGVGRYLHNLTDDDYYLIVNSVEDTIDTLWIVSEEPDVYSTMDDGDDVEISDGVRSGDTFAIIDFAHVTGQVGTSCNDLEDGYIYLAGDSQASVTYAELCDLGDQVTDRYGAITYDGAISNLDANEGLTITNSYFSGGFRARGISDGGTTFYLTEAVIEDNLITGTSWQGIVFQGIRTGIKRNRIMNSGQDGILAGGSSSTTSIIQGNYIHDTGSAHSGVEVWDGAKNLLFKDNVLFASSTDAILIQSTAGTGHIFFGNKVFGQPNRAFFMQGGDDSYFVGNQTFRNQDGIEAQDLTGILMVGEQYGIKEDNYATDIDFNDSTGASQIHCFGCTLGSTTEIPANDVSATGAYFASFKHDSSGASKIWGEYTVPDDTAETPNNEGRRQFNYADASYPDSFSSHRYSGSGTEDTNLAFAFNGGSLGGSSSYYLYRVRCKNTSGCSDVSPSNDWDVFRDEVDIGDATTETQFTDATTNVQFTIDDVTTDYSLGDTYTFVVWRNGADTNTQKSITMMQTGDTLTVGTGETIELKGGSTTNRTLLQKVSGATSYGVTVTGTIDANYYKISGTDASGLNIGPGATVTDLDNGLFDDSGGAGASDTYITVVAGVLDAGAQTWTDMIFDEGTTDSNVNYNVTLSGTPASCNNFWRFNSSGNKGGATNGEANDSDGGDGSCPDNGNNGYILWLDQAITSVWSFQRKTFFDPNDDRYWRFYYDGSEIDIFYNQTPWSSSWTPITSLAENAQDYSVWDDDTYVYIAYLDTFDIRVRRGTLEPTTISWGAEYTALNGSGSSDTFANAYISQDSAGYLWVIARYYNGTNYYMRATRSDNANDVSSWTGSVDNISSTTNTDSNVYGVIVPLATQDMYAVWYRGSAIEGREWDDAGAGDKWDPNTNQSPDAIATGQSGMSNNLSASTDTGNNVHLGYIDGSNFVQYLKCAAPCSGTFGSSARLDSSATNNYVTVAVDTFTDNVYVIFIRSGVAYYNKYTNAWQGETDTGWDEGPNPSDLTANYRDNSRIYAVWTSGNASPFTPHWDYIIIPERLWLWFGVAPLLPLLLRRRRARSLVISSVG